MKKLLLSLLLSATVCPAFAAESAQVAQKLPMFGIDVPIQQALKTVVPVGWTISVVPKFVLPSTLSWSRGQPWTSVLATLGPYTVDWAHDSVLIGKGAGDGTPLILSPQSAQASKSHPVQGGMVKPSAVGPSSTGAGPLKTPVPAVIQAKAEAETTFRKTTPALMERPQPKPGQSYARPVSFAQPSAESVAQSIATKYGYTLVWGLPDFRLQGPVTLLDRGVSSDVSLLNHAIGFDGPAYLSVDASSRTIIAAPRNYLNESALRREQMQPAQAVESALAAVSPAASRQAASTTKMLESMVKKPVSSAISPAKPTLHVPVNLVPKALPAWKLTVKANEHLETALNRYLQQQGYHLDWEVDGGLRANSSLQFTAHSLQSLLYKVLSPLDLSANVYSQSKQVKVFPVNPAAAQ